METFFFIVLTLAFWFCAGLLAHSYLVYPFFVTRLARGRDLPAERFETDSEFPEVAVLMAVYNEESVLEETLASILASHYPKGRLTVWIGSDGSTDRSHAIVADFQIRHPELRLRIGEGRNGKIRTVNGLAAEAAESFADPETALFVLCDANVAWAPGALRTMVRHFKRAKVGLVGCNVTDAKRDHEGIGDEEEAYVGMENRIKHAEGVLWGKMMGAFGACYVTRARAFVPVPESYIVDDFFQTMTCLQSGREAIVDLEAVCYEAVSTEIREEFRRKQRIATGNFQNLRHFRDFLLPGRGEGTTVFAFWSHKGLRWIGPLLLIGAFLSCAILALVWQSPLYALAFAGILASLVASGADSILSRYAPRIHLRPLRFLRYFYVMNFAMLYGLASFLRGVRSSVWEPTRRIASDPGLTEGGNAVES